jgi:hypothetical protein
MIHTSCDDDDELFSARLARELGFSLQEAAHFSVSIYIRTRLTRRCAASLQPMSKGENA